MGLFWDMRFDKKECIASRITVTKDENGNMVIVGIETVDENRKKNTDYNERDNEENYNSKGDDIYEH